MQDTRSIMLQSESPFLLFSHSPCFKFPPLFSFCPAYSPMLSLWCSSQAEPGPSWTATTAPWDRSMAALEKFPSSHDSWLHSSPLHFPWPWLPMWQPAQPSVCGCGHAARRAQAQGGSETWSRACPWASLAGRLSSWVANLILGESPRQTSRKSIVSIIMQYS